MPVSTQPDDMVRSIWFGMRCDFTREAMSGAMELGSTVKPAVVVLPRSPRPASPGWPVPPFDRWLHEREIAVVEVGRLAGPDLVSVHEAIQEHRVTLGVGACFPMKVPASLREALPGGVLNIHPSLLPQLRGREPVFHAYRQGLVETGVTVHLMDDGWDSGPILAQERIAIPDEGRAEQFEATLARIGGRRLGALARRWQGGEMLAIPQDDAAASWAPAPSGHDLAVPSNLTVTQVTRFINACGPLSIVDAATGEAVLVREAVPAGSNSSALRKHRNEHVVECRDGVVLLRQEPLHE